MAAGPSFVQIHCLRQHFAKFVFLAFVFKGVLHFRIGMSGSHVFSVPMSTGSSPSTPASSRQGGGIDSVQTQGDRPDFSSSVNKRRARLYRPQKLSSPPGSSSSGILNSWERCLDAQRGLKQHAGLAALSLSLYQDAGALFLLVRQRGTEHFSGARSDALMRIWDFRRRFGDTWHNTR